MQHPVDRLSPQELNPHPRPQRALVRKMENSSVLKGLMYGGFASMLADIITLPIDTTKTRLQLSGSGSIK